MAKQPNMKIGIGADTSDFETSDYLSAGFMVVGYIYMVFS